VVISTDSATTPQFAIRLRGASTFNSDVNYDGTVSTLDLPILSAGYRSQAGDPRYDPTADINADGAIDVFDLPILSAEYRSTIDAPLPAPSAPTTSAVSQRLSPLTGPVSPGPAASSLGWAASPSFRQIARSSLPNEFSAAGEGSQRRAPQWWVWAGRRLREPSHERLAAIDLVLAQWEGIRC
jgi:hypothetical protein